MGLDRNISLQKTRKEIETIESFNYQWKNIPNAKYLLTDEDWRRNVAGYILDELQVTQDWIKGKTVIDVGCGGGRWSYGFAKLGCIVTATDITDGPCRFTAENVPQVEVIQTDLFELPKHLKDRKFDIVWCWGVIHHTNDPKAALNALVKLMHKDSVLHLYVYSADRGSKIRILRLLIGVFSLKNRERLISILIKIGVLHGSVHGWFDALSPKINHEISEPTLREWFATNSLEYRQYTPQWVKSSKDIFVTGKLQ